MSACRIARRVASMTPLQNPCTEAVDAETLVRKVFHYLCQSFSPWAGRRRVVVVEQQTVVGLDGNTRSSTGVRLCLGRGGARRFVWQVHRCATPLITASLVTNEKDGGVQ
jgi:hypothetical protein